MINMMSFFIHLASHQLQFIPLKILRKKKGNTPSTKKKSKKSRSRQFFFYKFPPLYFRPFVLSLSVCSFNITIQFKMWSKRQTRNWLKEKGNIVSIRSYCGQNNIKKITLHSLIAL